MREEKKYPEGYGYLEEKWIEMKIRMDNMALQMEVMEKTMASFQRTVYPVIEELQDFGMKISNPHVMKKRTNQKD